MKIGLNWLRDFVDLPIGIDVQTIGLTKIPCRIILDLLISLPSSA